ncbi:MAG: branched-chain amino acid ABC transporter permease [Pseudomonadota bacterium]
MSTAQNYTVVRFSNASRIAAIVATVLLIVLALAPYWAGRADMRLLSELFLYMALASLWNLLAGYAGLVSVGQQAFVGFGGYCLFALTIFFGLSPLVAIPLAGALGALVSIPVAVLIFRLRGAYFAIGTWVIAEVFRLVAAQISALGGGSGTSLPVTVVRSIADSRAMREATTYWMALGIVVLVLVMVCLLLRSRRGVALTAIRDNELASQSLGIDIWRAKFFVYVVTGALTAAVGALIFLQKLRISPDAAFSVNDWTAFVIFIVVIGGIGTIEGPIIGTIIFFLLRETLADLGALYLMILGLVAIVIMLRAPKGIWGYVRDRTGLDLFALSRRVVVTGQSGNPDGTSEEEKSAREPQVT